MVLVGEDGEDDEGLALPVALDATDSEAWIALGVGAEMVGEEAAGGGLGLEDEEVVGMTGDVGAETGGVGLGLESEGWRGGELGLEGW